MARTPVNLQLTWHTLQLTSNSCGTHSRHYELKISVWFHCLRFRDFRFSEQRAQRLLYSLLTADISEEPADWIIVVGEVQEGCERDGTSLDRLHASKTLTLPAHRTQGFWAATTVTMQFTNGHRWKVHFPSYAPWRRIGEVELNLQLVSTWTPTQHSHTTSKESASDSHWTGRWA